MNDTSSALSTRIRVAHSARFLLVAGAWLLADAARGDEPPKVPAPGSVLNLSDGGVVPGVLGESSRAGEVRWKSDSFATPFDFALDGVQSIRFPVAGKTPRAGGAFGFELSGGDVLFGSVVAMDDKVAELDVARLGRLRVDRARIRRIFRWRDGADLLYNGPNGLAGWREFTPAKAPPGRVARPAPAMNIMINGNPNAPAPARPNAVPAGPGWVEDGGALQSSKDGVTIQGDVGLPSRASIELELSWKQTPDFLLALGVSDDEKTAGRAFRLEVWEGQLVALRETDKEADLAVIQPVPNGPGRIHLRLFLDQTLGKLLIFSENGESLADLKLGGPSDLSPPDVRLTNIRGDLRLERLRVGRWNGEAPKSSDADHWQIDLVDGSIVRGRLERFDPDSREFVFQSKAGEARIAEARIADFNLSRPREDPPSTVRVVYQDGTRLGGEWVNVEGSKLILTAPGIAGPTRCPLEGLRSLDVLRHVGKPRDKDELTGTLEMDGLRLLGRLANSGDRPGEGRLAWQPLAGESASPIRPGASGRIVYRTPPPKPTPPARVATNPARVAAPRVGGVNVGIGRVPAPVDQTTTLPRVSDRRSVYLRTGDVIPAEVTKIDETGVSFKTDFSENTFVPHARIKAVELAAENPGSIRVNKAKFERLLTLPRMQKESPPTHLIRSKNGDILRGRVIGMDDKMIRVGIRLEERDLPRDRVSRIIWLHADETDPSKKLAGPPEDGRATRVQAVRSDGIRLTFAAERFADGALLGKSEVLGDCKVKLQELDQLLIGGSIEKEATQLAYQNFKLQDAPEPKSAQVGGGASPDGGAAGTESALVGKDAPDFQLDLLGGKKFHLAENKGKVIVLDFWATWCGPCLQAMPQIDRVTREFADKGVQLIAVNLQETPAQITAMLERQKLSPTVALDRDGVVAEKYGANAIPQTVVIDRDGKVTRLFIGGGPRLGDQLREALQALMPTGQK